MAWRMDCNIWPSFKFGVFKAINKTHRMRILLTPLKNMSISHTNWTESAIDLWEMDVLGGLFMFRGD